MSVLAKDRPLPPGLEVFANAYKLDDKTVEELAQMWDTIRGRRPQTPEEWARMWEFVKTLIEEDEEEARHEQN